LLQGYQQMMERFGGVRRVRGDNYCALRATLFQVLSQTTKSPAWLQQDHFTTVTAQ
jgi:ubiquitin thioesterase otulin